MFQNLIKLQIFCLLRERIPSHISSKEVIHGREVTLFQTLRVPTFVSVLVLSVVTYGKGKIREKFIILRILTDRKIVQTWVKSFIECSFVGLISCPLDQNSLGRPASQRDTESLDLTSYRRQITTENISR